MSDRVLRAIHLGHQLWLSAARRRFERALRSCVATQSLRLEDLLAGNGHTAYGRAHRFDAIQSVRVWQDRVPIVEYCSLQPWIERAAAGESRVLTSQRVRIFERTSGSTSANKLVPYTTIECLARTAAWPVLHDLIVAPR
jgi:hypothetical protein